MKLLDLKTALNGLKRVEQEESISVYTFKKDRKIKVFYQNNRYHLEEEGYKRASFAFDDKKQWYKTVKEVFNTEFPRSNKLYVSSTKRKE